MYQATNCNSLFIKLIYLIAILESIHVCTAILINPR